jgi:hypothetical protein
LSWGEVRKYNKWFPPAAPHKNNCQRVAVIRKMNEKVVGNTAHLRGRYSRQSTQETTKGGGVRWWYSPPDLCALGYNFGTRSLCDLEWKEMYEA